MLLTEVQKIKKCLWGCEEFGTLCNAGGGSSKN